MIEVAVEELVHTYPGGVRALDGVTLRFEAGESVEWVVRLLQGGQIMETAPPDDLIRMHVPDERTAMATWSA